MTPLLWLGIVFGVLAFVVWSAAMLVLGFYLCAVCELWAARIP